MNYIYTKISLDVQNIASQLTLSVKRGDTSRGLMISLTDNGKVYNIPDRCYATFSARKSDGTFVDCGCTIKDNFIIFEFSEQLTIVSGRVDCDITLYDTNNQRLISPLFTIHVYETIKSEYAEDVVSSDAFTVLTDLITTAQEEIVNTKNATENANVAVDMAHEAIASANEANEIARGYLYNIQTTTDGKLQLLDADGKMITTIDTFCGDDDTLHRYVDGMLSVIGIKERNKDNIYRVWVGTHDDYVALSDIDPTTFYWVTDDNTYEEFVERINTLIDDHNELVEGYNILESHVGSLAGRYLTLQSAHDDLVLDFNDLQSAHDALKSDLQDGRFEVKKASGATRADSAGSATQLSPSWKYLFKNEGATIETCRRYDCELEAGRTYMIRIQAGIYTVLPIISVLDNNAEYAYSQVNNLHVNIDNVSYYLSVSYDHKAKYICLYLKDGSDTSVIKEISTSNITYAVLC